MLFVSSTFTDTHLERDRLQESILPKLRSIARLSDIAVVIYDMRWGVRDENTADHFTWVGCHDELQNCVQGSDGKFFLSLQSNKYGYCMLPKAIPKLVLDERLLLLSPEESTLCAEWYILNENTIPQEYVLKSLEINGYNGEGFADIGGADYWRNAYPKLLKALDGVAFWPQNDKCLVGQSVTEYEFKEAARLGIDRCAWLKREVSGDVASEVNDPKQFFSEYKSDATLTQVEELKQLMHGEFGAENSRNIFDISVDSADLILKKDVDGELISYTDKEKYKAAELTDAANEYIGTWESTVFQALEAELGGIVRSCESWSRDGQGLGMPGAHLDEIFHHYKWGKQKLDTFLGRSDLVQSALLKVSSNERGQEKLRCVNLAIIGQSGAGKTAFCAKLADELWKIERGVNGKSRLVLLRFCGTSAGSSSGLLLVQSLIRQIAYRHDVDDIVMPTSYSACVEKFHDYLKIYPLILIIDSLDQLSNEDEARSSLTFLREAEPHCDTIIVVSTLPDEAAYMNGCSTRLAESIVPSLKIPLLTMDDPDFLAAILESNHKKVLGKDQMELLMDKAADEPTVLYVTLASRAASSWVSSQSLTSCELAAGVKNIIIQIFKKLENDFGQVLVKSALSFITYSVAGVSTTEMEDLLSLDDAVLDATFQYSTPIIRRMPSHVWLRLKIAMSSLIVERSGGIQWYHRQLAETAVEYFSDSRNNAHKFMGSYFGDIVSDDLRVNRRIAAQPRVISGRGVWWKRAQINARRATEAAYHMVHYSGADLTENCFAEMCCPESVCAAFRLGPQVGGRIVFYYKKLYEKLLRLKMSSELITKANQYY